MDINSLAHTKWNCKYHIVFAPKYRRKIIYGQLKHDFYEKRYIGYVGIASDTILKEKVIMEMIEFMKNKTFLKTI